MSLEGVSGAGKSTLVKEYATAFPHQETEEGTRIPVFYLETPSPVTVKGMAAAMLEQLGDPAAHRGALWSMNSRLVRLIIACEVELVILDDFHHLIDVETNRILQTVSEWLKVLIKETGVPFLVVGIEGKVEQILKANPQLSRLFAAREVLQPFQWDTNDPYTLQEFAQFIQYVERAIDMPLTESISRPELLYRMYYATAGIVANIMNLMRYAQSCVLERQSGIIELIDLACAYDKRLSKHLGSTINPFEARPEQFALQSKSLVNDANASPNAIGKRSHRRPRGLTVEGVLTTK